MEIIRADKNTDSEVFAALSALDKMCVGNDGWSAESFKSEAEKDNGIVPVSYTHLTLPTNVNV